MRRGPSIDRELTLGEDYMVGWGSRLSKCRLIQPTKKGFSFLNLETNKCILKHHLYAKGYFIPRFPKGQKTFRFVIFVDRLIIKDI